MVSKFSEQGPANLSGSVVIRRSQIFAGPCQLLMEVFLTLHTRISLWSHCSRRDPGTGLLDPREPLHLGPAGRWCNIPTVPASGQKRCLPCSQACLNADFDGSSCCWQWRFWRYRSGWPSIWPGTDRPPAPRSVPSAWPEISRRDHQARCPRSCCSPVLMPLGISFLPNPVIRTSGRFRRPALRRLFPDHNTLGAAIGAVIGAMR